MLYLVPTPIGNLKDITLRALEVLNQVDAVICEDSRRTGLLLHHYQIKKPLIILNDFNESKNYPLIFNQLKQGKNFALVSDAGTPLIGDPGYKLVRECLLSADVQVDSLPGPTSITTALTLSSLPPQKFLFLHYLPEKEQARINQLEKIKEISKQVDLTYIIFVAPHKLLKTLIDIKSILGDIPISLVKELSKIHQESKKMLTSQWIEKIANSTPKGEYILLFHLKTDELT